MELRLYELPRRKSWYISRQAAHRKLKSPSPRIPARGSCWARLPTCARRSKPPPSCIPRQGMRQSPIAGIALANADLDHVLGLLLLRELQPLRVHRHCLRSPAFFARIIPCSACCKEFRIKRYGLTSNPEKNFLCATRKAKTLVFAAGRGRSVRTIPPTSLRAGNRNSHPAKLPSDSSSIPRAARDWPTCQRSLK